MPHIPTRSPQYILLKGFFFFFFLITFVSFVSIRLGLRNGDQLLTLFFYIFFFFSPCSIRKETLHHRSRIWSVAIHMSEEYSWISFFFDFTSHSFCIIRLELAFSFPFREIYHFFFLFFFFSFFFPNTHNFPYSSLVRYLWARSHEPDSLHPPFSLEGGDRMKTFNFTAQNIVIKRRRWDLDLFEEYVALCLWYFRA